MAATNTHGGTSWTRWLDNQLEHKGWSQRELARKLGIDHTRISKARRSEKVDVDLIRDTCAVLGVTFVEGLIAAGVLTADDVGATVINRPDVHLLSNAELLAEIGRRMVEPGFVSPRVPVHDAIDKAVPEVDTEHDEGVSHLLRALQASVNAAHGGPSLLAINAYVEEEEDGHKRLVALDPTRFGDEGRDWAARRRTDESDKPASQG